MILTVSDKRTAIFLTYFIACLLVGSGNAQAQSSALVTSGMGGGASSTSRLTAQMAQQQGRVDDIETCGNKARFYGPNFGGAKDSDNCLTGLTLTTAGDVGVGTTPTRKLDVNGDAKISTLRLGIVGHGSGWPGIANNALADAGGEYAIIQNSAGQTLVNSASGQSLEFRIGNSTQMLLTSAGNLGIGTSPSAKLHVNGTLRSNGALTVSGGGAAITGNVTASNNVTIGGDATADNYYHTSDRRLKSNIRPLEEGESIVARLKPVRFDWKKGSKTSIGFIAQDVEDVLPEAVITNESGYKAMDYDMLAAPMVAALQAQQAQIAAQQQEIRKLQAAVVLLQNLGR